MPVLAWYRYKIMVTESDVDNYIASSTNTTYSSSVLGPCGAGLLRYTRPKGEYLCESRTRPNQQAKPDFRKFVGWPVTELRTLATSVCSVSFCYS